MDLHPPKREVFDPAAGTNTDPKGIVRPVEVFREDGPRLYMARAADHPTFDYVESWLLPELDLRVTDFHFRPGHELPQDFYVDAMTTTTDATTGRRHTVDLYLDLVCRAGERTEVVDADELAAALAAGLLEPDPGRRAVEAMTTAAIGIAAADHDLERWLAGLGIRLGPRAPRHGRRLP